MRKIFAHDPVVLRNRFIGAFLQALETLWGSRGPIFIGLSWGRSLLDAYAGIIHAFPSIPEDARKRIRFCLLDERVVSPDSAESNSRLIRTVLVEPLVGQSLILPDQAVFPDVFAADSYARYSESVPRLDIALVGVGEDGHVCSLFPRHPALSDTHAGYIRITDSPKPPSDRITVSPHMLRNAHFAFVFFMGESKRQALGTFLDSDVPVSECPARLLLKLEWPEIVPPEDRLTVVADWFD